MRVPRPVRRFATAVVLMATSVVLALGALEIGLRAIGWNRELTSNWMLGSPAVTPDPEVIMIRRRLLDPGFYAPPSAPLVLSICDSFTEGFPVDLSTRAYPAVLERLLARRGSTVTVRNAGMGDTGPDQQLRLLETYLLPRFRPVVVVWQLYANDVWDNIDKSLYRLVDDQLVPLSGAHHWLARRQRLYDWTPLPAAVKQNSRLFRLLLRVVERSAQPRPPEDSIDWSVAKIAHELDAFDRLARDRGFVPYVALVHPQSTYLVNVEGPWQRMWNIQTDQRLLALLRGRADFIDGGLGANAADGDFADDGRDHNLRGDRHLNERGYARLAAIVAHRLVRDGTLAGRAAPAP